MLHVQTNLRGCLCAAAAALLLAACSDGDKKQAEALYGEAENAMEGGNYLLATQLLDSIDNHHKKQIEVRRKAMHLRTRLLESQTLADIAANEAEGARLQLGSDSLQRLIKKVDNPIEPYFVADGSKSIAGSTGIEARMSPDGMFYLISSLSSPRVSHTSVSVTNGSAEATTATIANDGERNDRSMGYEIIHYMMPECDTVGVFIAAHEKEPLNLRFNGEKGKNHTVKLTPEQASSIATLYRAASAVRDLRLNSLERQRLEKQLEISRSQAARTFEE